MASTTSSSTSGSTLAVTNTALPANTSLLLLSNMSSMMTVKLDYGHYTVWKHQIEVILETYTMIDILDDSIAIPDCFLKDSSSNLTIEINPNFISWKNREQAMFTFINSTLSPSILAFTVGQKSAKGVWKVLEKRFASVSRSHVMSLRNELSAVKKGIDTINGYFQKIKQIRDKLVSISVVLDDEELLHIAFDALPSEYDSFSSAIRTRSDVLLVEELNTLLNVKERVIKKRINNGSFPPSMAMNMNFQSQNHGFSNQRGRGGRYSNQRGRGGRGNYNNHNCFTNNNGGFTNSGNSG